jgi:hypothetical protein
LSSSAMRMGAPGSVTVGFRVGRWLIQNAEPMATVKRTPAKNMKRWEPLRCPECGCGIGVRHTHYPYFACPACRSDLCVPTRYQLKAQFLGTALAFSGLYLLSLRGIALVLCGILLSLMLGSLLTIIGLVVIRPTLERYIRDGSLGLKL